MHISFRDSLPITGKEKWIGSPKWSTAAALIVVMILVNSPSAATPEHLETQRVSYASQGVGSEGTKIQGGSDTEAAEPPDRDFGGGPLGFLSHLLWQGYRWFPLRNTPFGEVLYVAFVILLFQISWWPFLWRAVRHDLRILTSARLAGPVQNVVVFSSQLLGIALFMLLVGNVLSGVPQRGIDASDLHPALGVTVAVTTVGCALGLLVLLLVLSTTQYRKTRSHMTGPPPAIFVSRLDRAFWRRWRLPFGANEVGLEIGWRLVPLLHLIPDLLSRLGHPLPDPGSALYPVRPENGFLCDKTLLGVAFSRCFPHHIDLLHRSPGVAYQSRFGRVPSRILLHANLCSSLVADRSSSRRVRFHPSQAHVRLN